LLAEQTYEDLFQTSDENEELYSIHKLQRDEDPKEDPKEDPEEDPEEDPDENED
jgi:hypothetical protein